MSFPECVAALEMSAGVTAYGIVSLTVGVISVDLL